MEPPAHLRVIYDEMQRDPNKVFDELLIVNAQSGDKRAFAVLAAKWNVRLRRQIHWKVQDMEVAKDLTQESWIAIAKGLWKLKDPAKFGPWACRIANNKATDWIRKRRRHPTHSLNEVKLDDREEDPAEDMMSTVRLAMAQLPASQLEILRWHYLEEMGIGEISELLQVPEGTVKSRLFRAREHLKKIIRDHEKGR